MIALFARRPCRRNLLCRRKPEEHLWGTISLAGPARLLAIALGLVTVPAVAMTPAQASSVSCPAASPGRLTCAVLVHSHAIVKRGVLASPPAGYGPTQLQAAYGLQANNEGMGQTVAVVEAGGDPNAEADLAVYRTQYGLPACSTADGCLTVINQTGGTTLPPPDTGYTQQIPTDLDMVSAVCPNCHILLVEANDNAITDGTQLQIWTCSTNAWQDWAELAPVPAGSGTITLQTPSGECLDNNGNKQVNTNTIDIWTCNGTGAQKWSIQPAATIQNSGSSFCIGVNAGDTSNGSPVILYTCNAHTDQEWIPQSNGSLRNLKSGRCLDDPSDSTVNGTQQQIWSCNTNPQQNWNIP